MHDVGSRQLDALRLVTRLLEDGGVDYWLFGGWAVDFYLGAASRAHDDLDLAVWHLDVPRIAELLQAEGWHHAPSRDDDGGSGYERGTVRLELTFLVRDGDGRIFTPLRDGRASWAGDAFGNDVRELHGVRSRVVGFEALRRMKSSPRDDPQEAARDRADFGRLTRLRT